MSRVNELVKEFRQNEETERNATNPNSVGQSAPDFTNAAQAQATQTEQPKPKPTVAQVKQNIKFQPTQNANQGGADIVSKDAELQNHPTILSNEERQAGVSDYMLGEIVRSGEASPEAEQYYRERQAKALREGINQPQNNTPQATQEEIANIPHTIKQREERARKMRKHNWRDWLLGDSEDEEFSRKRREKIAAIGDVLRHMGNLYGTSQGAISQNLISWRDKADAMRKDEEAEEERKKKADRDYNIKLSEQARRIAEAKRKQDNADRLYRLKNEANERERNLYPHKLAKAEADAGYAKDKERIQKAVGEGKITEQEAKAEIKQAQAKWAGAVEQSKANKNNAAAAKEYAHAGYYNRKDANGGGNGGSGRGKGGSKSNTTYGHAKSGKVWDVPKSKESEVNRRLRAEIAKPKYKKYIDAYKKNNRKRNLSEGDYDKIARQYIGIPALQDIIKSSGATERDVESGATGGNNGKGKGKSHAM